MLIGLSRMSREPIEVQLREDGARADGAIPAAIESEQAENTRLEDPMARLLWGITGVRAS